MNEKFVLLTAFCFGMIFEVAAQRSDAEADAIVTLLGVQKNEAVARLGPNIRSGSRSHQKELKIAIFIYKFFLATRSRIYL